MGHKPEVLFPNVRAAREALKGKALEIFNKHIELVDKAIAAGDYETAEKALEFLSLHMPKDEDGGTFLEPSIDKTEKKDKAQIGPQINIGFKIGGVQRKGLPPAIDVKAEEDNEDKD